LLAQGMNELRRHVEGGFDHLSSAGLLLIQFLFPFFFRCQFGLFLLFLPAFVFASLVAHYDVLRSDKNKASFSDRVAGHVASILASVAAGWSTRESYVQGRNVQGWHVDLQYSQVQIRYVQLQECQMNGFMK
jgi:hypothetical protein